MKKYLIAALAAGSLLTGCKSNPAKSDAAVPPQWKGAPYHLALDTAAPKPGQLIPAIQYTANPDALERRAVLVVRFDSSNVKTDKLLIDQVILPPTDVTGAAGTLPPDYVALAGKDLAQMLDMYKVTGKVKYSVLLTRSSLGAQAGADEIQEKALSAWLTGEVTYKGHGKQ